MGGIGFRGCMGFKVYSACHSIDRSHWDYTVLQGHCRTSLGRRYSGSSLSVVVVHVVCFY